MSRKTDSPPDWIAPGFHLLEPRTEMADFLAATSRLAGTGLLHAAPTVADAVPALIAASRGDRPLWLRRKAPGEDVVRDAGARGFGVYLATSGTTGAPKITYHSFAALKPRRLGRGGAGARWLLTYDLDRYAGLQVLLTAMMQGAGIVAPETRDIAAFADAAPGVSHVSATPTFWRALLTSGRAGALTPTDITLGGEITDQGLLDRLAAVYPLARIRHIYASTEAGTLFAVADGRAGFPKSWLEQDHNNIGLRVRDGELQARTATAMAGYVAAKASLTDDGWLRTGDLVEVAGDRVLFLGRADAMVKVAGVMVSPEAVERLICAEPEVADALVRARANPITGHVLTADIVAAPGAEGERLLARLRQRLQELEAPARPGRLRLVSHIEATAAGKKRRLASAGGRRT